MPIGESLRSARELALRARHPRITITDPPRGVERIRDLEVKVRDGTVLRLDAYVPEPDSAGARIHQARRPDGGPVEAGRYPVIMCAHPYGKDNLPKATADGYEPHAQYRIFRQPDPLTFSAWTGWEAPDPAFWCARGYVVVNADLRGFGQSEGTAVLLSEQEACDYEDLIGWVSQAPWSNGRVGLLGVSYLALSQYRVAARRPPGLAAICPWEGFSDPYRDFARPGGGREDGFIVMWSAMNTRTGRVSESLRDGQRSHPLLDDFWRAKTPDLSRIRVPLLVCASFSDQLLHSRGSAEAFRRTGSAQKWMWAHRSGKWSTFYGEEAKQAQLRFMEQFVAGVDSGMEDVAPVRLATQVNSDHARVSAESDFPPPDVRWRALSLRDSLVRGGVPREDAVILRTEDHGHDGTVTFSWTVDRPVDLVGPLTVVIPVSIADGGDALLFAGLRLGRNGTEMVFEGSYGFAHDMVTHGQLRLSHRELDDRLSTPHWPVHTHADSQPLAPDEIITARIPLLPQATALEPGDMLRLDITGHWFFPTNPLTGQFPAKYEPSPDAEVTLHLTDEAHLLAPLRSS